MIQNPSISMSVYEIHRMYCMAHKCIPTLRFGQYFLNIAFPSIQDPKLFYCEDNAEAMEKILYRYCYFDGNLKPVNDELITV